jgi:hypothetical protein
MAPAYWAEALATATYVLNGHPSTIGNSIPFQVFIARFLIILTSGSLGFSATKS